MSGETGAVTSGWTTDTLRDHYDVVLREMDQRYEQRYAATEKALHAALVSAEKAVAAALEAAEKAVIKAEYSSEKRFASVNEFRAQLADQAATFVPRAEYRQLATQATSFVSRNEFNTAMDNLKEQVTTLRSVSDASVGANQHQRLQVSNIVALCAIVGMIVSIMALILSR